MLLAGVAGTALAMLGAIPVQRFLDRSAPAPFTHRDPEPAPPLGDCRIGQLDTLLRRYDRDVVTRARGWAARFALGVAGNGPGPFAATIRHTLHQLLT